MVSIYTKSGLIHTVSGIIFGIIANTIYTNIGLGVFSGIITMIFLIIGFIISGHITAIVVGKDALKQNEWFSGDGPVYFFMSIVFWTMAYNGVLF